MSRVLVRLLLTSVAVAALAALQPVAVWSFPDAKQKWIRVTTQNFTLVGNAKSGKLKEMALQLERFRAAVVMDRSAQRARSHLPTTILVFKNDKSYRPYKLNQEGVPDNFVGKFVPAPAGNFISIDADAGNDPFRTIFHEYIHYVLSKEYEDVPLWLNEGMAEFYSTFWTEYETVEIGRPVDDHVRFLGQQHLMPLVDLFEMKTSSKDYNEGIRQGIFYAQSWVLYHYLYFANPSLLPNLGRFLETRNSQMTTHKAFVAAFGMDYEDLESTLRQYVAIGRFNYQVVQGVDLGVDESVQVEPMPYSQLLFRLGDYLHHAAPWQSTEAEAHLREAIRVDPKHAAAHASLAAVLERAEQLPEAERYYRKAIVLAPDDARIHYLCGWARTQRFLETHPLILLQPEPFPELLGQARPLLERCVQLNPSWADAYATLGHTYLFDPDNVEQGIGIMRYAGSLMPNRFDLVYGQVILNLRAGNRQLAEGLVNQVLIRTTRPQLLEDARQMLEYDKKLQEFDLINDAIDKANQGDYAAGITILESLMPGLTDAKQKEAVSRYLKEFRTAEERQRLRGR